MPPVSSVLGNCVVCKEAGIKASPSAACARGTGRDGLANHSVHCYEKKLYINTKSFN